MSSVDLLSIIGIAFGLSADCFAVALSASIVSSNLSRLQVLRASFSFGLFQAIMTALGWLLGRTVVDFIADYDHWVAFALLAFIGGRMIWESFHSKDNHQKNIDITKGWLLLTLSIATSIDALAVGLSFAFLQVNIAIASAIIGIIAFLITIVAFLVGNRAGILFGKRAEIIGGVILILIGIRIVVEHLL